MPATNGIIQFKYGLQEKYDSLANKDLNTIYFTTNEQRLFVGDVEYSRPVGHGTSLPAAFVPANSMFVVEDGTRRELHYSKDGSAWELVAVLPAEITAGIVGANTAGAVGFGGTIKIPKITYDKHGNITAAEDVDIVLPSETPVDVEVVKQGNGNAVTEITAEGDTVTYKMGVTFATASELDEKQDALEFNTAYNKDTNKVATMTDVTNAVAGLSGAMHFKGAVSDLPATAEAGDVYLVGNKEYVWDATQSKFVELGDETIYAVKGNIKDVDIAQDAAIAQSKIAGLTDLAQQVNTNKGDISDLKDDAHTHDNKSVIDGITASQVTNWDDANAKKHTHSNKALLDTYTQTEANLADAVSKKHAHTNKAELDKIVDGDVAKWNAKQDTITFNTDYDANTNKAATMADIADASLVWQTI